VASDFFEHLQQVAREPDPQPFEPPIDCPRCAALVLRHDIERHMDYHERNEHK
jgi:hypothetical protein